MGDYPTVPCKCIKAVSRAGALMSVVSMVLGMIDALNDALGDAGKHDRGNNAAGTRVRTVSYTHLTLPTILLV